MARRTSWPSSSSPGRSIRTTPTGFPPLILERKEFLDPKKNPFYEHADIKLFLAMKDREIVGRIAAIVNHSHIRFHEEKVGFFGLFECIQDQEVAKCLFDRTASWLCEKGMVTMRGPMNFSTNEEVGILIKGFDSSPFIMMTYNPPYYIDLIEGYGFRKAKDLYAYYLDDSNPIPERLLRLGERIMKRGRFRLRKLEMQNLKDEIDRFKEVYNSAWEINWGFIPMTDKEIDRMANELKLIIDPDLIYFVETDDEIIGFSLALPDINEVLKKVNGRLFPLGLFRLLWDIKIAKKISGARILVLGVLKGYRHLGVDSLLYLETFKEGLRKGYTRGEASWILEDNVQMLRPIEAIGARHYKTYRIYDCPLSLPPPVQVH